MSLTPFFTNTFVPALPNWTSFEHQLDRDLARMHRMVNDSTHHLVPDQQGIYHRQPNYSFEENDQQANLELELPGVAKENVKLDLHENSLVITANRFKPGATVHIDVTPVDESTEEKHQPQPHGNDVQITKEQPTKPEQPKPSVVYTLKLRMGQKYDADNIQATMVGDGILNMVIPIKKKTAKMIPIHSANM